MNREKRLFFNFLIYFIGNFASKLLGFILLPVYTFYLSKSELGFYDLVLTSIQILISIVSLQSIDGLYRNLLDAHNERDIQRNISNTFFIITRNMILFILVSLVFFTIRPIPHGGLIIALCIAQIYWTMWQQTARGLKRNFDFAMAGLIFTVVMLLSNLILLKYLHYQVNGILISGILSACLVIFYLEVRVGIIRHLHFNVLEKSLQQSIISYSLPLLPTAINWWILSFSNRFIINITMGSDANGLFAVASRFASILVMVNNIFYLAWQESAITEYNSNDRNRFYSTMFNLFARLQFSMILVLLPITSLFFHLIIDAKFKDALQYIPFLYIGTIFSAFSTFYGTGYLSSRETKGAFYTTLISSVLNLLLMIFLIPIMKLQAIGLSSMISLIVLWIIRIFQTKKYFRIEIDWKVFFSLASFIIFYLILFYQYKPLYNRIMGFVAVCILVFVNRTFIRKLFSRLINLRQTRIQDST